jgi:D-methionine transport system ATP-binding protein
MDVVKRICHSAAVMRDGRFVESGPVAELLRRPGSELTRGLFPLPPHEPRAGETVVDITVSGAAADEPILAEVARRFERDVRILDGAVETLAATRAGRLRIALPGSATDNAAVLAHLRERGALVTEAAR